MIIICRFIPLLFSSLSPRCTQLTLASSLLTSVRIFLVVFYKTIFRTGSKRLQFLFLPWRRDLVVVLLQTRVLRRRLEDGHGLILLVSWRHPERFFFALLLVTQQDGARVFLLCRRFLQGDVLHDVRRQCTTVDTDSTARTSTAHGQIGSFGFDLESEHGGFLRAELLIAYWIFSVLHSNDRKISDAILPVERQGVWIDDVHVDEEVVGFLLSRLLSGEQHSALSRSHGIVEDLHDAVARRAHDLIEFGMPQGANDARRIAHLDLSFGLREIVAIEEVERTDIGRIVGILCRFLPCRRARDQESIVRREGHVGHREPVVQVAKFRKWLLEFSDVPQLQRVIGRARCQVPSIVGPA